MYVPSVTPVPSTYIPTTIGEPKPTLVIVRVVEEVLPVPPIAVVE
jgi:hypothetical protein